MSWGSLSFPFGSLLTAAKMTQVASNFASLAYQESGAPQLGGQGNIGVGSGLSVPAVGSFGTLQVGSGLVAPQVSSVGMLQVGSGIVSPQVSSLGAVDVHSQYTLNGQIAKALIQSIFTEITSQYVGGQGVGGINVYSTYMVASITPKFSDSLIKIKASVEGIAASNGSNQSKLAVNLTRGPGGVPGAVLTASLGPVGQQGPNIGDSPANGATRGTLTLMFEESSPGSGTATQYAVRWAEIWSGNANVAWGQMNVEEWR